MKIFLLLPLVLLVGCSNIPPQVREFAPEVSYRVKADSDPFGVVSRGLQVVQSAVGEPCLTANTSSTYRQSTNRGIDYKVDCTH